ncbi:MAG: hypothetical protein WC855_06490 [Thermodesulfovibrionales bacterium]
MHIADINRLFDRIRRLSSRLEKKEGAGYQWSYTFPDGIETTYILKNIKNLEEIEDDIANLFIWAWNLKDYLKELAKANGRNPQEVEDIVNSDRNLQICADITNRLKHGRLRESRSSSYPKLDRIRIEIPHTALASITYRGQEVELNISKAQDVLLSIAVLNKAGDEIGDGFKIFGAALSQWEKYFRKVTKTS